MTSQDAIPILRRGILALLALGAMGVITELILLEHYEEPAQFVPLALLALTLATILWHWIDGGRRSLRAFQVVMLLMVVAGTIGIGLHLRENVATELDLNPGSSGLAFWLEVVRGDLPTLAPGTLVQFGLLGLLYAYRHPALNGRNGAAR
ncbi:MAG TPA: hypothetical protein VFM71_10305 [Gemmatimonadaceae bacterium]|nr:hypothetical protein [Gemmatimonadaceae bacterium]